MSIKQLIPFAAAAMMVYANIASAETIHFNLTTVQDSSKAFIASPYSQGGYTFTAPGAAGGFVNWDAYGAPQYNAEEGTGTTLFENFGGFPVVLTNNSGTAFSFSGIGLADLFNNGIGGTVQFTFNHTSGAIDTDIVTLQNGIYGLQNFSFASEDNLSSVSIQALTLPANNGFQFDNAVVSTATSAVPEPSTWAMMLVGFAGLGFAGYRRNKSAALAA